MTTETTVSTMLSDNTQIYQKLTEQYAQICRLFESEIAQRADTEYTQDVDKKLPETTDAFLDTCATIVMSAYFKMHYALFERYDYEIKHVNRVLEDGLRELKLHIRKKRIDCALDEFEQNAPWAYRCQISSLKDALVHVIGMDCAMRKKSNISLHKPLDTPEEKRRIKNMKLYDFMAMTSLAANVAVFNPVGSLIELGHVVAQHSVYLRAEDDYNNSLDKTADLLDEMRQTIRKNFPEYLEMVLGQRARDAQLVSRGLRT